MNSIKLLLFGLVFTFIGWNAKPDHTRKDVVSTEIIRATSAADLASIPATTADVLVCVDLAGTTANGTLNFPSSPINGQTLSVTTRSAITTITNSSGAIPISGAVTTLAAGAAVAYVYCQPANRWYKNP